MKIDSDMYIFICIYLTLNYSDIQGPFNAIIICRFDIFSRCKVYNYKSNLT